MIVLLIQLACVAVAVFAFLIYAAAWVQRWRLRRQIRVIVRGLRKPEDAI